MMACQEDVVPVYIMVMIVVLLFLMWNAFRGFAIYGHYHKNRIKNGLPWDESILEYSSDLEKIKNRYGKLVYYISYGYVSLSIKLFNHPYMSFMVTGIVLFFGLLLLLSVCK